MKTVKVLVLTLMLGLAGIAYASDGAFSSTKQCKMMQSGASCCAAKDAKAAKAGCCKEGSTCKADSSCCTEGSSCCASDCCKEGASCCATDVGGCKADAGCCAGHSCCSAKASSE